MCCVSKWLLGRHNEVCSHGGVKGLNYTIVKTGTSHTAPISAHFHFAQPDNFCLFHFFTGLVVKYWQQRYFLVDLRYEFPPLISSNITINHKAISKGVYWHQGGEINQTSFLPPWKISRSANTLSTPTYNFRYILPSFLLHMPKPQVFIIKKFKLIPVQNEVATKYFYSWEFVD